MQEAHPDAVLNVEYRLLDLVDNQSIRDFATEVTTYLVGENIDILIHNAGVAVSFKNEITEDGRELTMATNVHGPFLLTHMLYEKLKEKRCRIILVTSVLHKLHTDKLNKVEKKPAMFNCVRSKQAQIHFAYELARRLKGTDMHVYIMHPGLTDSDLWRSAVPKPLNIPMKGITWLFMKSVPRGAQTSIYVALAKELADHHGRYYKDCKEAKLSKSSTNMAKALEQWNDLETKLLGDDDPRINPLSAN